MFRKLTTASLVALLALLTLSVVWAGLNWPPPLWIVEYGLPGSQGPTGRVARIEGIRFGEVVPGSYLVPISNTVVPDGVMDRILAPLLSARVPVLKRPSPDGKPEVWCLSHAAWSGSSLGLF